VADRYAVADRVGVYLPVGGGIRSVVQLGDVEVAARPLAAFRPLIGDERHAWLEAAATRIRTLLGGTVVWNVSSTASGGGVAEMLHVLVAYIRGAGIDARWVVTEGDLPFFVITKRIHNRLHGIPGDEGALGHAEAQHYAEVTAANAALLCGRVKPGDVVLLHDPQTAGLAPALRDAGARVIWRSHIGSDTVNRWTDEAWGLLRPYLAACDAFVFSRRAYVPTWVPPVRVSIIPPSIDPFSPKNQAIPDEDLPAFLARIGLISGPTDRPATFRRGDGTPGEVVRPATIVSEDGHSEALGNLVVQVSRWDRLKDMHGVMAGFASHVVGRVDARLALVGPSPEGVMDDPEGAAVLAECVAGWAGLPADARRRIRIVTLPMDDVEENAAMVNALQRSATVIVQKSLAEGFGLTVAEGMWKGKPVVASRVGGIIDQVVPGTGVLLDDATDLEAFGDALVALLERPDEVVRLGANARRHVLEGFVGDRHLLQYAALIERLFTV
jgi:trehalose synthase